MAFTKDEVLDYEKKRYRGLDQRIVHNREKKILANLYFKLGQTAGLALDLPCGYGRFSGFLLERHLKLISCDISPAMVERSGERAALLFEARSGGVVADAVSGLPFKDGVFSLLLSMRFFHHIHNSRDRQLILGEFCRVTSGGVLLSYYQENALHKLQRKLRRIVKKAPTRIKMITEREFRDQAERAGFEVISVVPLFGGLHAQHIALLKRSQNQNLIPTFSDTPE